MIIKYISVLVALSVPISAHAIACHKKHADDDSYMFPVRVIYKDIAELGCEEPYNFECIRGRSGASSVNEVIYVAWDNPYALATFNTFGYETSVILGPKDSDFFEKEGIKIALGLEPSDIGSRWESSWLAHERIELNIYRCQYRRFCKKTFQRGRKRLKCFRQFIRIPSKKRLAWRFDGPILKTFGEYYKLEQREGDYVEGESK